MLRHPHTGVKTRAAKAAVHACDVSIAPAHAHMSSRTASVPSWPDEHASVSKCPRRASVIGGAHGMCLSDRHTGSYAATSRIFQAAAMTCKASRQARTPVHAISSACPWRAPAICLCHCAAQRPMWCKQQTAAVRWQRRRCRAACSCLQAANALQPRCNMSRCLCHRTAVASR